MLKLGLALLTLRMLSCFRDTQAVCYLVEPEEAEVSHHAERAHSGARGDLTGDLETDLHDLKRIGENHLRSTSLWVWEEHGSL